MPGRHRRVASSNLRSVRYHPNRRVLEVRFRHGGTYRYADVPVRVYRELLQAPSKGRFFYRHVRDAFPYVKVPIFLRSLRRIRRRLAQKER